MADFVNWIPVKFQVDHIKTSLPRDTPAQVDTLSYFHIPIACVKLVCDLAIVPVHLFLALGHVFGPQISRLVDLGKRGSHTVKMGTAVEECCVLTFDCRGLEALSAACASLLIWTPAPSHRL